MTLVQKNGDFSISRRAREVFDVTGAGDTVISVLAASLAAGVELKQTTILANTAAAVVVGKLWHGHRSPAKNYAVNYAAKASLVLGF